MPRGTARAFQQLFLDFYTPVHAIPRVCLGGLVGLVRGEQFRRVETRLLRERVGQHVHRDQQQFIIRLAPIFHSIVLNFHVRCMLAFPALLNKDT